MRGFQYKDKEGVEMFLGKSYVNASFTLSGVTLTRGFTVGIVGFFFEFETVFPYLHQSQRKRRKMTALKT